MAGITLAQAQANLALWIEANAKVAAGQRFVTHNGDTSRDWTLADAGEIRNQIDYWDRKVKELTPADAGGRRRTRYVVPQ